MPKPTLPALPAVLAVHQLFSAPEKLNQFVNLNRALVGAPPTSLSFVFLYAYLPKLVASIASRTPEEFSRVLSPDWRCSPNTDKETLADVQSGLIGLLRRPESYAFAVKHCPALEELLEVPAFGWRAYDELLNAPSPRCFGEQVSHLFPGHYSRSVNRFDTRHDGIDAVYITDSHLASYMERLPLEMPKKLPVTFGEELRALDQLGLQALLLFEKCRRRGREFHDTAPASMRYRFHSDWRKATPYDTASAQVDANMSVFEKILSLK